MEPHKTIEALIDTWSKKAKQHRTESEQLFKNGHPEESGIEFGRQCGYQTCAEDLLHFIDYLQKQVHVAGKDLLSFEKRYPSDDLFRLNYQSDNSKKDKIDEHH